MKTITSNKYLEMWESIYINLRRHKFNGKFIVFEGIDGSGKSTLLERLFEYLSEHGVECIKTYTPTKEIRELSYWKEYAQAGTDRTYFDPFGLDMIAFADRMVWQNRFLEPNLEKGNVVLCDRHILNSLVYNQDNIFVQLLPRIIRPDLGFVTYTDLNIANERINQRGETENIEDIKEKKIIAERYFKLAIKNDYIVVDTNHSINKSFITIVEHINRLFKIK